MNTVANDVGNLALNAVKNFVGAKPGIDDNVHVWTAAYHGGLVEHEIEECKSNWNEAMADGDVTFGEVRDIVGDIDVVPSQMGQDAALEVVCECLSEHLGCTIS
jgi:hypothetical protein